MCFTLIVISRSLVAKYDGDDTYNDIPVSRYTADFGDTSSNLEDTCYCRSEDTCLLKGAIDMTKCVRAPIVATLPHFYNCDDTYVKGVKGVQPNKDKHEILLLFETVNFRRFIIIAFTCLLL